MQHLTRHHVIFDRDVQALGQRAIKEQVVLERPDRVRKERRVGAAWVPRKLIRTTIQPKGIHHRNNPLHHLSIRTARLARGNVRHEHDPARCAWVQRRRRRGRVRQRSLGLEQHAVLYELRTRRVHGIYVPHMPQTREGLLAAPRVVEVRHSRRRNHTRGRRRRVRRLGHDTRAITAEAEYAAEAGGLLAIRPVRLDDHPAAAPLCRAHEPCAHKALVPALDER